MTDEWRFESPHRRGFGDSHRQAGDPRITVEQILRALANGVPESELLADFPDLERDDLRACWLYAAEMVAAERIYPIPLGA